jgi:hypothetical protein
VRLRSWVILFLALDTLFIVVKMVRRIQGFDEGGALVRAQRESAGDAEPDEGEPTDASSSSWRSHGSLGSARSIGSIGSFCSIGSIGSSFSIGSIGSSCSIGSIGSFASVGSILSVGSLCSVASVGGRFSSHAVNSPGDDGR